MCKAESHFLMASKEIINIINNSYYKISCFPAVTGYIWSFINFQQRCFLFLDLSLIFSLIFAWSTTLDFRTLGSPFFRWPYRKGSWLLRVGPLHLCLGRIKAGRDRRRSRGADLVYDSESKKRSGSAWLAPSAKHATLESKPHIGCRST